MVAAIHIPLPLPPETLRKKSALPTRWGCASLFVRSLCETVRHLAKIIFCAFGAALYLGADKEWNGRLIAHAQGTFFHLMMMPVALVGIASPSFVDSLLAT